MAYFVTGGTGFIGRFLVANLLKRGEPVHVLVRKESLKKLDALRVTWNADEKQVIAVVGDLAEPDLGISNADKKKLKGKIKHMFHLAAVYDLNASAEDQQLANIDGTRNAVGLAQTLQAGCFHHETQMLASPDQQLSLTDPDARSMKGRDGGIVGYNVQTAVDAEHHLIVAHEVITEGIDRDQLAPMAEHARQALGIDALTVVADRGYFKGEQIRQCDQAGIIPIVPKTLTSNNLAEGLFDKQDFVYIAADDEYRCPAGQRAIRRFATIARGMTLTKYWSSACPRCELKAQCTTSKYRRITRWEHEAVMEAMQHRLDKQPEMMRARRQTVEHPFGTIKHWMGSTHFLTKTLAHVRTEMSLHVLAYNLKRVMRILGINELRAAMTT